MSEKYIYIINRNFKKVSVKKVYFVKKVSGKYFLPKYPKYKSLWNDKLRTTLGIVSLLTSSYWVVSCTWKLVYNMYSHGIIGCTELETKTLNYLIILNPMSHSYYGIILNSKLPNYIELQRKMLPKLVSFYIWLNQRNDHRIKCVLYYKM